MTSYQNSWNNEIEKLLVELKAPDSLHNELVFILSHNELTQIYPNHAVDVSEYPTDEENNLIVHYYEKNIKPLNA